MARSLSRRATTDTTFVLVQLDQWLAKTQLSFLLTAAVLVPLVVLPDSNFVDITSTPKTTILRILGSLQAGVLLSRLVIAISNIDDDRLAASVRSIKSSRPALAILGSIAAVGAVSVISAVYSILPGQSWWGRVPAGFEAGEYSALMYMVLAVSAFVSVRECSGRVALWRTIALTGFLASLVGFFQFLGLSPLDISATHSVRITGTSGNPIFFGAMLVVLAPVTLGVLLGEHRVGSSNSQRWWLAAIGLTSFLIAVSLVAVVSRGPWLGAAAGGVTAVALLIKYRHVKFSQPAVLTLVALAVIGTLVATFVDPTPPEIPEGTVTGTGVEPGVVSSAFSGVGRTSTMDLRLRYWRLSRDMSLDRDPVPFTRDAPRIIRWLFGYGPDMFRFAGTYFSDSTTFTRRLTAAHNDPINRLVEQGLLGFIAWMALWVSIAYGTITLVRHLSRSRGDALWWIGIGIAAAMAGRFVEQLFGSPTPGGVLIFWITIGGLAALLTNAGESGSVPVSPSNQHRPLVKPRVPQFVVYASLVGILSASAVLAWDRGVNYLLADQAASIVYRADSVSAVEATGRLERATNLAPDVPRYWQDLADIELGRAASTSDEQVRSTALSRAYGYDLKAYQANTMEVASVYRLAFSAWQAGNAGRPELRQEAKDLYERLTTIIPSDELARERLTILTEALGR